MTSMNDALCVLLWLPSVVKTFLVWLIASDISDTGHFFLFWETTSGKLSCFFVVSILLNGHSTPVSTHEARKVGCERSSDLEQTPPRLSGCVLSDCIVFLSI